MQRSTQPCEPSPASQLFQQCFSCVTACGALVPLSFPGREHLHTYTGGAGVSHPSPSGPSCRPCLSPFAFYPCPPPPPLTVRRNLPPQPFLVQSSSHHLVSLLAKALCPSDSSVLPSSLGVTLPQGNPKHPRHQRKREAENTSWLSSPSTSNITTVMSSSLACPWHQLSRRLA